MKHKHQHREKFSYFQWRKMHISIGELDYILWDKEVTTKKKKKNLISSIDLLAVVLSLCGRDGRLMPDGTHW